MYVLTSVHEDPAVAHEAAAYHVAYYLRDIPGYYGRVAENAGYAAEVEAVRDADTTEDGATRLSEEFLDVVGLVGTPESVRDELADVRAMGVDLPVVRAPAGTDRTWVERTLEAFSPGGPESA